MIRVGVGMSTHQNAVQAGKEAAQAAMRQAGVTSCDFVMMFATVGYAQQDLLKAVRSVTGNAKVSGGSGCGVITQTDAVESNHVVTVQVWQSDTVRFRNAKATELKNDSRQAGETIARGLGEIPPDAKALFVLADGISLNFDRFREGFESTARAGRSIPMIGGATNDNWLLKRTYQYHDDEVLSDGVSVAMLCGDASVACEVNHGCNPIGHERTITRAEGNVIYEIDNIPALQVVKEYLDDEEVDNFDVKSMAYVCLGFKAPTALAATYDEYVVRFIPQRDEASGSVTIQTNVEVGTKVWMTRRDADKMYRGVEDLGKRLHAKMNGRVPKAVLHFDCAGRGKLMFSEEERNRFVTRLQELVGRDVPWIGLYTAGEIAPVAGQNHFHNFTAVVSAIY
jgi:hypothetical protein